MTLGRPASYRRVKQRFVHRPDPHNLVFLAELQDSLPLLGGKHWGASK